MCGVIVVDAELFRSSCHGRDAYIHDHCIRYRHNYALFYQLLNSNLFTHRMFCFKREASSETYGSRVYFPSYIFRSINQKTQKYLAAIYLFFTLFYILVIFYIYLYQISSLQVTTKGLTTPLSRWVQVFDCLCRCIDWRLACTSYWIDTLVLKLREILISTLLHHPFLFKEKTNASTRSSRKNFWCCYRGDLRQVKTYQVPIIKLSSLALHYSPFASHFPL